MRLLSRLQALGGDTIALGTSAIVIAAFSTLLYADLTAKLDVGDAVQIGTITYKKRLAQRKYGTQVVWEDIEQNVPVFNNDSIRTAELSEAVIHLKDGTDIQLDDNSMILLALAENAININFSHGSIFAKRGDVAAADIKQVNIVSKEANVSIEKSDVKISKEENKELNLTVTKGTAKLATGSEVKTIKEDQRVVISKDAKEAKVYEIRLKLSLPEPGQFIVTTQQSVPVNFSWEKISGASEAFFELSADGGFSRIVTRSRVTGTVATANLSPGSYYWRLNARNPGGGTDTSETRKLTVVGDRPVQLTAPLNGAQYTYIGKPPIISFRWQRNAIATGYTLEIAPDAGFSRVIRSVPVSLTEIALDTLEAGTYFWRVRTSVEFGAVGYAGSSAAHQFSITRRKSLEPPVLIAPAPGRIISASVLKAKGLIFSWNPDRQVKTYRLSVARDANFSTVVFAVANNGNFLEMERPLPEGAYFWRVQGIGESGEAPVFSSARQFTVAAPESIRLLAPASNAQLSLKDTEKSATVNFSWQAAGLAGRYQFELARDRSFTTLHTRQLVDGTGVSLPLGDPGAYYWRVRLIDASRAEIMSSDIAPLSVKRLEPEKPKAVLVVIAPAAVTGAAISVDGRLAGYGRVTVNPQPGVATKIEIVAKEFEKYEKTVTLSEGQNLELRAEMVSAKKQERVAQTVDIAAPIAATPVTAGGLLIVSSNDGRVSGFRKDGSRAWSANLQKRFESSPAVEQSQIFIVTVDGVLYSISVKTGAVEWSRKAGGTMLFGAKPLVVGDRVYLATGQGVVQAFSRTGAELWQKRIEGGIYSSPAYHDGILYVGTNSYRIFALRASDGREEWSYELDGRIVSSSPKVANGTIYIGSFSGSLYALHAKKGKLRWLFKAGDPIIATPSIDDGTVYIGSSAGVFFALSADSGSEKWRYRAGDKIQAEAVTLRDTVYVPAGKYLYALRRDKGTVEWKKEFDHPIKTSAAAVGDELFFGLENGRIVSVRTDLTVRVR